MAIRRKKKVVSKKSAGVKKKVTRKKGTEARTPSWMGVGAETAREEIKRQEREYEERSQKYYREFFLVNDGDVGVIAFLHEEPITYYVHRVKVNGKWKMVTCKGEANGCLHCAAGLKASFRAAWNVIDRRTYTDRNGKKHRNTVKVYSVGTLAFPKIDKIAQKYGLLNVDVEITRHGKGTKTEYSYLPEGGRRKLSQKERLVEQYDLATVLAPPSDDEARAMLNMSRVDDGDDSFGYDDD